MLSPSAGGKAMLVRYVEGGPSFGPSARHVVSGFILFSTGSELDNDLVSLVRNSFLNPGYPRCLR